MFSNQFAGVVKTVCAAAKVKVAMLLATRFTDYELLNCPGDYDILKPSNKAKTESACFRARGESGRTGGKSNQRITADIKALQHYAESVAHKIVLFLVNDRVCHQFYIA